MMPSRRIQGYSKPLARCAEVFAAVSVLALAVGCGDGDVAGSFDDGSGPSTSGRGPGEAMGSVSFALTTAGDLEFDAFRYAITGPDFSKAGSIDVSDSRTVSALIEGIPVGTGYSITLIGTSSAPPEATCSGASTFDVAAGAVTSVPISVACRVDATTPPEVPVPPFAIVLLGLFLLVAGAQRFGFLWIFQVLVQRELTVGLLSASRCRSTR